MSELGSLTETDGINSSLAGGGAANPVIEKNKIKAKYMGFIESYDLVIIYTLYVKIALLTIVYMAI